MANKEFAGYYFSYLSVATSDLYSSDSELVNGFGQFFGQGSEQHCPREQEQSPFNACVSCHEIQKCMQK